MARERKRRPLMDRVWERIDRAGRCWVWRGPLNNNGYARIATVKPEKEYVHRLVYQWAYGELEPGQVVMHACDNPPCCNPAHLRAGSQADNMMDMHRKGRWELTNSPQRDKTHCSKGHEFTPENTHRSREGWRHCRTCHRNNERLRKQNLRRSA